MGYCTEDETTATDKAAVSELHPVVLSNVNENSNKENMEIRNNVRVYPENSDNANHDDRIRSAKTGNTTETLLEDNMNGMDKGENSQSNKRDGNNDDDDDDDEVRVPVSRRIFDSDEEKNNENNFGRTESYVTESREESESYVKRKKSKISEIDMPKKKSKKMLREERLKIYSETHRLMREREITVPYHIAKRRTLKEFMERKKNQINIPIDSPASQMIEVWKQIEESTKEAFEFFRSSSDSEPESDNEQNKPQKSKAEDKEQEKSASGHSNANSGACGNSDSADKILNSEGVEKANEQFDKQSNNEKSMKQCEDKNDAIVNEADDDHSTKIENPSPDAEIARQRTSEWVNNIPQYEKALRQNKKEALLQRLDPKLLEFTPELSGEPDSLIDLDTGKSEMERGTEELKRRFFANCVAPQRRRAGIGDKPILITLSERNEKGEIHTITTEKLVYASAEVMTDPSLERPGAKLQRLREELKRKIEEKWEIEHKKRLAEMELEKKEKEMEEKEVEDEEEEVFDVSDESSSSDEEEEESEPEENDMAEEKEKKKSAFIDSEAEESDCDGEESGVDEEKYDDVDCSPPARDAEDEFAEDGFTESSFVPPYQPGGGLLNGGYALSQGDDEDDNFIPKNVLSPTLGLSQELSPLAKNADVSASQESWENDPDWPLDTDGKRMFVPRFQESQKFSLSDAYEFCSGKFPDEAGESVQLQLEEPRPSEGFAGTEDTDSQLSSIPPTAEGRSSLSFQASEEIRKLEQETEEDKSKRRSRLKILDYDSNSRMAPELDMMDEDLEHITSNRISSDDESDNDGSGRDCGAKVKKKRRHFKFSDDEDDGIDEPDEGKDSDKDGDDENDDPVEEEDDDGGSSQVPEEEEEANKDVLYDSEEEEINPTEFFEKEAELSGSEWSGDEDERGLDDFEVEDGDADKLDQGKVKSQLEKIHMRRILDDDARDVRMLQEILFDDGDLFDDGPKREKNMRWKNLGGFFDDDEEEKLGQSTSNSQPGAEDEMSAKERHEKEMFLLKLKRKRDELDFEEDCSIGQGTSLLKTGKVILERSNKVVSKERNVRSNDSDEVLIKTPFENTNKRGSFLSRNEEFLSKLAKFTANSTDNILGPKHSKNFVFATKSPEKENTSTKENSQPKKRAVSPKASQPAKDVEKSKKSKTEGVASSAPKFSILDRLT